MKIAVYGNVIVDHIWEVDKGFIPGDPHASSHYEKRLGGVGNFCRSLKHFFPDREVVCYGAAGIDEHCFVTLALSDCGVTPQISLQPVDTSQAAIIIDKENRDKPKSSIVQWGACMQQTGFKLCPDADWHHFMYLDTLPFLKSCDLMHDSDTIVSADLCRVRHTETEQTDLHGLIGQLDYLICSIHESYDLGTFETLGKLVNRYAILHRTDGSFSNNGLSFSDYCISRIEKRINVLGAGDCFAACFTGQEGEIDIGQRVKRAHEMAGRFLNGGD